MKPGTRVVSNTFTMEDWEADETATVERRVHQLVHGVSLDRAGEGRGHVADAAGRSRRSRRSIQMLVGNAWNDARSRARCAATQITFTAGKASYTGRVNGNTIQGTAPSAWIATKR